MSKLTDTWGKGRFSASFYDAAIHNPVIARIGGIVLWGTDSRKLFAFLKQIQQIKAGTRLLDVPCGGGLLFNQLNRQHGLDYNAFDFSPTMLERAQQRATRLKLGGITFQQGDVGALPYDDSTFDLALSYNGMHCFPDPEQAVSELARVLKPGGTLRMTLIVKNAGWRFDKVIKLFQWRGWFGPGCTRAELQSWLAANNLTLGKHEQSGALWLFEAIKSAD